MAPIWIPLLVVAQVQTAEPVLVHYASAAVGRQVTIILDGKEKRSAFAGKLSFQDANSRWTSVCGEVRRQINPGQFFTVQPHSSKSLGGNIAKAGNIVAKHFAEAKSMDECAGLQLAVWEAIEDGGAQPDYSDGRFQVKTSPGVLRLAQQYYQAISIEGTARYLQQAGGQFGPGGQGPGNSGGGQGQFSG